MFEHYSQIEISVDKYKKRVLVDDDCISQFKIFEENSEASFPFPSSSGIYLFVDNRGKYDFRNVATKQDGERFYSGPSNITKLYMNIMGRARENIKKTIHKLSILQPILMDVGHEDAIRREKVSSKCPDISDFTYFLFNTYLNNEFDDLCSDFASGRGKRGIVEDLFFDTGAASSDLIRANNEIAENQRKIQTEIYALHDVLDVTQQNVRITQNNILKLNNK